MSDGNILDLKTPAQDPLGELLKHGAQQLLAKAVEAELLDQYSDLRVEGRQAVVRNGHLPERTVQPVLEALLGEGATGLSANTVSCLKQGWEQDYDRWRQRDLSKRRYVYLWADGVYSQVRMDDKLCLLVRSAPMTRAAKRFWPWRINSSTRTLTGVPMAKPAA